MSRGYVYVMSNPSMPGLVKIGRTSTSVEARRQQLQTTGVLMPFVIEGYVCTPNCAALENSVHSKLSKFRVIDNREFFEIHPSKALNSVIYEHAVFMDLFINQYLPESMKRFSFHEMLCFADENGFGRQEISDPKNWKHIGEVASRIVADKAD